VRWPWRTLHGPGEPRPCVRDLIHVGELELCVCSETAARDDWSWVHGNKLAVTGSHTCALSRVRTAVDYFRHGWVGLEPRGRPYVHIPVEVGARLRSEERARRRSDFFVLHESTTVCVFVTSWMVVMAPRSMPCTHAARPAPYRVRVESRATARPTEADRPSPGSYEAHALAVS